MAYYPPRKRADATKHVSQFLMLNALCTATITILFVACCNVFIQHLLMDIACLLSCFRYYCGMYVIKFLQTMHYLPYASIVRQSLLFASFKIAIFRVSVWLNYFSYLNFVLSPRFRLISSDMSKGISKMALL